MNANEVCAMIDAITEGKPYTLKVEGEEESANTFLYLGNESVVIQESDSGRASVVKNPRVAREIACALVAWANQKDGNAEETI